jgi:hypothetical protein
MVAAMGERARFVDANAAGRAAIDSAVAAKCSAAALRTLLGVIKLITLYSRTEDRLPLGQIAAAIGLDGPAGERQVGRHLLELHRVGAVRYEPARGRRQVGSVGLPKVAPTAPLIEQESGVIRATYTTQRWRGSDTKVARITPKTGANGSTSQGFNPSNSRPAASNPLTHDGDQDVVAAAFDILYKRRPPPKTSNHAGYRRAIHVGLAKDHADALAQLDWNFGWTPQTLADWLEPAAAEIPVMRGENVPPGPRGQEGCTKCDGDGIYFEVHEGRRVERACTCRR